MLSEKQLKLKQDNYIERKEHEYLKKDKQHQIEKIAFYGFKHHATLEKLSQEFDFSCEELKAAMNELLPLLNPDLYEIVYEQYGLNEMLETSLKEKTRWKRK